MVKFLQDYKVRRWLYGIATAVLLYLGGAGIITAVDQDNFSNIAAAVLNVGGAGVTALAARKADPVRAFAGELQPDTTPVKVGLDEIREIEQVETVPRHAAA